MHKASIHEVNYESVCLLLPRPIISWCQNTRLCLLNSVRQLQMTGGVQFVLFLVDQQHFKLIVILCSSYDFLEITTCIVSFNVFLPLFETDVVGWLSSSTLGSFGMYCAFLFFFLPLSMEGRNVALF